MHVIRNLFILFENLHKCEKKIEKRIFDFFFEKKITRFAEN